MADIEDLGKFTFKNVFSLPKLLFSYWNSSIDKEPETKTIPKSQKIYVKTWGCSHNNSDGEYLSGILYNDGYFLVNEDDKHHADLWILNGCTVKNPSEDNFKNFITSAISNNIKIVLAGCIPQADKNNEIYKNYSIIGINQLDRVSEVVEETIKGNVVQLLKKTGNGGNKLDLPKIRKNNLIEIIPINTGCLNNCTYCKTKFARGNLNSYPMENILKRISNVINEGVTEIWLTSEDTGTYGRDINTNITVLLDNILNTISSNVMIRLGMTNPPYIIEHIDSIIKILQHQNIYSFLHLPVQSGSNKVLNHMQRYYTKEDFCFLIDKLIEVIPDIHIATDIICGFPTETEEDFLETIELLKKYNFITVNISQFYPRRGTIASEIKQLDTYTKKNRTRVASEFIHSYNPYEKYIGQIFNVLCTEISAKNNYYVAHNKYYHQILVPKNDDLMGKFFNVRIIKAERYYMIGELL